MIILNCFRAFSANKSFVFEYPSKNVDHSTTCKTPRKKPSDPKGKPDESKKSAAPECRSNLTLEVKKSSLSAIFKLAQKLVTVADSHYYYQVERGPYLIRISRPCGEGCYIHIEITDKEKNEKWNISFEVSGYMEGEEPVFNIGNDPESSGIYITTRKTNKSGQRVDISIEEALCKIKPLIEKEAKYPHQMKVTADNVKVRSRPIPTDNWVVTTLPKGSVVNVMHITTESGYHDQDYGITWAYVKIGEPGGSSLYNYGYMAISNKKGQTFMEEVPQPKE